MSVEREERNVVVFVRNKRECFERIRSDFHTEKHSGKPVKKGRDECEQRTSS
jgi:hypothetical protein